MRPTDHRPGVRKSTMSRRVTDGDTFTNVTVRQHVSLRFGRATLHSARQHVCLHPLHFRSSPPRLRRALLAPPPHALGGPRGRPREQRLLRGVRYERDRGAARVDDGGARGDRGRPRGRVRLPRRLLRRPQAAGGGARGHHRADPGVLRGRPAPGGWRRAQGRPQRGVGRGAEQHRRAEGIRAAPLPRRRDHAGARNALFPSRKPPRDDDARFERRPRPRRALDPGPATDRPSRSAPSRSDRPRVSFLLPRRRRPPVIDQEDANCTDEAEVAEARQLLEEIEGLLSA